jgi:hypothetical protein
MIGLAFPNDPAFRPRPSAKHYWVVTKTCAIMRG